jgi:hypothetical protein
MAKKKAGRPAGRAAGKPVRNAKRSAASRRRTTMKKPSRRAASARKNARKAPKRAAKPAAKASRSVKRVVKKAARPAKKAVTSQKAVARPKAATKPMKASVVAAPAAPAASVAASKSRPKRPPTLDRERRTVQEIHGAPSSLGNNSPASAAKSGRDELRHKLERHTSSSPALTAGDVDADWESADSSGDEAPGGDNPTPDQDVVDEIGRALGVEYDDDEELQGGDEIADRDRHRWELDPGSAEDSDDRD